MATNELEYLSKYAMKLRLKCVINPDYRQRLQEAKARGVDESGRFVLNQREDSNNETR